MLSLAIQLNHLWLAQQVNCMQPFTTV